MSQRVQLRRDTAANWTSANPILMVGELCLETDTMLYKIGNGSTTWNLLPYKSLQAVLASLTLDVAVSEPSNPADGTMALYPKKIAGKTIPKWRDPNGLSSPVQGALYSQNIHYISPGATTVPTVIGGSALTAVGTVSHPALVATNTVTSMRRFIVTSAATANSISELRTAATAVWRGNAAGLGGFFHRTSFTIGSATALQRAFIGFNSSTAATATTQSPSALLTSFGVGFDSADTNLQIMSADATSGIKINLGVNFPTSVATNIYEFTCHCPPNSNAIHYQVVNVTTGDVASGTVTTNLPLATTFLAYHAWINNGGTAAACVIGFKNIYTEVDL